MILVTDLRKITCCPNCGNSDLEGWYNVDTQKESKYCDKCDEEILEKELDLCIADVDSESVREFTINEGVSTITTTYATAARPRTPRPKTCGFHRGIRTFSSFN